MLLQTQTELWSLSQREWKQWVQVKQTNEEEVCSDDHWMATSSEHGVLFQSTKKPKTKQNTKKEDLLCFKYKLKHVMVPFFRN